MLTVKVRVCEVGFCTDGPKAKGLCNRHYQQLRRMSREEVLAQASDAFACEFCGTSLARKRSNARFCNRTCKMAGWHVANRATTEGKSSEQVRNKARYAGEALRRRSEARAYYHLNAAQRRAYAVQWRRENPHRRRDQRDRRAELMLSNPGFVPFGDAEWQVMLRIYGHRCAYCGLRADVLEKDHIVPLTRGGRHAIGNIAPACKSCNISKYDRLLVDWRARVLASAA